MTFLGVMGLSPLFLHCADLFVQCQQPGISHVELEKQIISLFVPLSRVTIYHRIKYTEEERHTAYRVTNTFIVVDSIHAEPEH